MKHNPQFLHLVEAARTRIQECTVEEVNAKLEQQTPMYLLDVREDHEFAKDHVCGARHLGKGVIERDIEEAIPDVQAEIILYCGGGFRSALAADSLQTMGYRNVKSMAGGIRAWREASYPLERGTGNPNGII